MLKQDLTLRNPLRLLGENTEDNLAEGGFGAVLARAGVGKTALTVQIALNSLLKSHNVLHISLNDPVNKVTLWYKEVFKSLAGQYNLKQINQLWEAMLAYRFIMTFRVEGFSVPKLEERLNDLTVQKIFIPRMVIIDGMPFDAGVQQHLLALKEMARRRGLHMWFTVQTHRHEPPRPDGLPPQLDHIADLFEVVIQLAPQGEEIHITALKGADSDANLPPLQLDPSTMLIKA